MGTRSRIKRVRRKAHEMVAELPPGRRPDAIQRLYDADIINRPQVESMLTRMAKTKPTNTPPPLRRDHPRFAEVIGRRGDGMEGQVAKQELV